MANELVLPPGNAAGLTVTAKVYTQAGVQQGSNVSCTEVGSTSVYRGDMPTASEGVYLVRFDTSSKFLGTYEINWTGSAERTEFDGATAAALATTDGKIDTVDTVADAILVDTGTTLPSTLSTLATASALTTVSGKIDTVDGIADSILVDTGTTIPAQISGLNNISTAQVNTQVDTALSDYDAPTKAELDTAVTDIKGSGDKDLTEVFTASGATGISAVQTVVDAIKVATDKLTFSGADVKATLNGEEVVTDAASRNASKADISSLNDVSQAEVLAQATSALGTYDGPTKTEMDTFQTAITALINALNDLSAADVNAQVDSALADYDGPTKTELDAGFAALNDPSAAAIVTAMSGMVIEGSLTLIQYIRAIGAGVAGDGTVSVDGGTVTYKNVTGAKAVLTATVNAAGNRTITKDLT